MRSKFVLWGTNAQDEKILIAVALRAQDNMVEIRTFSEAAVTEDFYQRMMKEWRDGEGMELPEPATYLERELSVTEPILPDDLKPERADVAQRAQSEWHFLVLSEKLRVAYESELAELKARVDNMERYEQKLWDSLKGFWDKLQNQSKERTLSKEHADLLRDNTNVLFTKMKELRTRMDNEFSKASKEVRDGFMAAFQVIEQKINEGGRMAPLFDELQRLQSKFKGAKMSREHGNQVWDKLNATYKAVKEKRYGTTKPEGADSGEGAGTGEGAGDRLGRRSDGLRDAIQRMEQSIQRDKQELNFQQHKIDTTDGQLEAQIRKAKIIMIEERVRSKAEKLAEMKATQADIDKRLDSQKEKQARHAAKEAAREAAKQKIAEDIKTGGATAAVVVADEAGEAVEPILDALEAPEVELSAAPAPAAEEEAPVAEAPKEATESLFSAASTLLGESLGDVIDTVKAVASVIGDRIGDAIEDLKENMEVVQEKMEQAAEVVEDKMEQVADAVEDKVEQAAEVVEDKMEQAADAVKDKVEQVVEEVASPAAPAEPAAEVEEPVLAEADGAPAEPADDDKKDA